MRLFFITISIELSPKAVKWLKDNHSLVLISNRRAQELMRDKVFQELNEKEIVFLDWMKPKNQYGVCFTFYGQQIIDQIFR